MPDRNLVTCMLLASLATTVAIGRADADPASHDFRKVASFADQRDQNVVRQGRDFSCGAAALATLLKFQWRDDIRETDILETLSRIIPGEELEARRQSGLTLLDLQRAAGARGYRAAGYRIAAAELAKLTVPVIVFIDPYDYPHFAVLKGVAHGRAYVADPAHGNVSYPLYRFIDMWSRADGNGIIFAAEPFHADPASFSPGALAVPASAADGSAGLATARSLLPGSALTSFPVVTGQ